MKKKQLWEEFKLVLWVSYQLFFFSTFAYNFREHAVQWSISTHFSAGIWVRLWYPDTRCGKAVYHHVRQSFAEVIRAFQRRDTNILLRIHMHRSRIFWEEVELSQMLQPSIWIANPSKKCSMLGKKRESVIAGDGSYHSSLWCPTYYLDLPGTVLQHKSDAETRTHSKLFETILSHFKQEDRR